MFGRPKTPEVKASRSQSNIRAKLDESSNMVERSDNGRRTALALVTQSMQFNGVLKDASKKLSKQNQDVDYVSRNKEVLVNIPKKKTEQPKEVSAPKNKNFESVGSRYLDRKPSVPVANKENNPNVKPKSSRGNISPRKESDYLSSKIATQKPPTLNRSPELETEKSVSYISAGGRATKSSLSQRRRAAEPATYSSRNSNLGVVSKSPKKVLDQPQVEAAPEEKPKVVKQSPIKAVPSSRSQSRVSQSKVTEKSVKRDQYKPETMDLFSRLNEYSKFKENCGKLCQPEFEESVINLKSMGKKAGQSKEKATAEEFLKKQISNFKENSPRTKRAAVQSSVNLQRVSQPRLKKQAVVMVNECSFQPMLSKKSMDIISKNGYDKEKLYQSKTPKKGGEDCEDDGDLHMPKLCEKSKHIDQSKKRQDMPRFEVLTRMGQEYSHRKKRQAKLREREEESELRSMSFKPDCKQRPPEKSIVTPFNADVVDRNQKWTQRRDEKVSRLKQDQDKSRARDCSFKPKIIKYEKQEMVDESQYCSSVFVKDGIKSYFTRLEQARRMKKDAQDRLENWGRDRSKSIHKVADNTQLLDISQISRFENTGVPRPQWETPGTNKEGYSSRHSKAGSHGYSSKKRGQPTQADVDKTVAILRENLKKIQIHLN